MVVCRKARFWRKNAVIIGEPFELSEYYGMKLTEELLKEADAKILTAMESLRENYEQLLEEKKGKKN